MVYSIEYQLKDDFIAVLKTNNQTKFGG